MGSVFVPFQFRAESGVNLVILISGFMIEKSGGKGGEENPKASKSKRQIVPAHHCLRAFLLHEDSTVKPGFLVAF